MTEDACPVAFGRRISARSTVAEAILHRIAANRFAAASAEVQPAGHEPEPRSSSLLGPPVASPGRMSLKNRLDEIGATVPTAAS